MRRIVLSFLLLALLLQCGLAQQRPATLTVGTATAARGQKVTGFIEVPAGSDAGMRIPVAVVNGVKPGPVLAIVAGLHGTEYATIVALQGLIGILNPAQVSGAIIVIPLVNVPSFEQRVAHLNPIDGKNMNRVFPGKADGTVAGAVNSTGNVVKVASKVVVVVCPSASVTVVRLP